MDHKGTKRLSSDKNYKRPAKTYQDNLTNQEIKEKLKEYKKVDNILGVSIGSHLRYFTIDPKTNENVFRLGGNLNKIDPEGRFVVLSNGSVNWSVQIASSVFYRKMSQEELKEEMKKELKKELLSEDQNKDDEDFETLKKEFKSLSKKYLALEKDYKTVMKKNEVLSSQINEIENEIKKNKGKK